MPTYLSPLIIIFYDQYSNFLAQFQLGTRKPAMSASDAVDKTAKLISGGVNDRLNSLKFGDNMCSQQWDAA